MINWRVRIKNPIFWRSFIPAVILAIQAVAMVFGWRLDLSDLGDKILAAVEAILGVLAILGVVIDPTTEGTGDSRRAMTYDGPHVDEPEKTS